MKMSFGDKSTLDLIAYFTERGKGPMAQYLLEGVPQGTTARQIADVLIGHASTDADVNRVAQNLRKDAEKRVKGG